MNVRNPRTDDERIPLPDGSELPPNYDPGNIDAPPPTPTPPPDGQTWDEYSDWSEGA